MRNTVLIAFGIVLAVALVAGCPDSSPSAEGTITDGFGADVGGIGGGDGVISGDPDGTCLPDCTAKACGDDGCGGSCGSCGEGKCVSGLCVPIGGCTPDCANKECGADGCGGSCGACFEGWDCKAGLCIDPGGPITCGDGQCANDESCTTCPEDCGGCGSTSCTDAVACLFGCFADADCIDACLKPATEVVADAALALYNCVSEACAHDSAPGCEQAVTLPDGVCGALAAACQGACSPSCDGKECGPDGCGGSCGGCNVGDFCTGGLCVPPGSGTCEDLLLCALNCPTGDMGCIKDCGTNGSPDALNAYQALIGCLVDTCTVIDPSCVEARIGGACAGPYEKCVGGCAPQCGGKQCGSDGCGGSCGSCGPNASCTAQGTCKPSGDCQPGATKCVNGGVSQCTPQGTWTPAKMCPAGQSCSNGKCQGACTPQCGNKQCGADGCGGSCGICDAGYACTASGVCVQQGCQPGQTQCQGSSVYGCSADGTWQPLQKCPANTTCQSGKCIPTTTKTCGEIVECAFGCPPGALECIFGCQEGASDQAAATFQDLVGCVLQFCDPSDPACFEEVALGPCGAQFDKCLGGCTPQCSGKQCGADGCGGSCGTCKAGTACSAGNQCVPTTMCTPGATICQGNTVMACGPNGAWTPTQLCPADAPCVNGKCAGGCVPKCSGKECGTDGCGGICGLCPDGLACTGGLCTTTANGSCVDIVTCSASCGLNDEACFKKCVLEGSQEAQGIYGKLVGCVGEVCGPGTPIHPQAPCSLDAMLGPCADIAKTCQSNQGCVPQCGAKVCGSDGCGGSCGTCKAGTTCSATGKCVATPQCQSGAQTCEGNTVLICVNGQWSKSQACAPGETCSGGKCIPGMICDEGTIGCLGNTVALCIGSEWLPIEQCNDTQKCIDGQCVSGCIPSCAGKQCGSNGCGGSCGTCGLGQQCTQNKCVAVTGNASCPELLDCALGTCKPSDTACIIACGQKGTPLAQQQFQSLVSCVANVCGFGLDQTCVLQAISGSCKQQYSQCTGGTTCTPQCEGKSCGPDGCGGSCGACPAGLTCSNTGTCTGTNPTGCYDMLVCMSDCDTDACAYDCFYASTPEAQTLYVDLSDCLLNVCGPNGDPTCYESAATGQCQQSYFGCLNN